MKLTIESTVSNLNDAWCPTELIINSKIDRWLVKLMVSNQIINNQSLNENSKLMILFAMILSKVSYQIDARSSIINNWIAYILIGSKM